MVLGVRDDAFENWDYIYFQKFFQRIQKRTGAFYKAWIPQIRRSVEDAPIKVFIMGHSLGMTDKEILKEFFMVNMSLKLQFIIIINMHMNN